MRSVRDHTDRLTNSIRTHPEPIARVAHACGTADFRRVLKHSLCVVAACLTRIARIAGDVVVHSLVQPSLNHPLGTGGCVRSCPHGNVFTNVPADKPRNVPGLLLCRNHARAAAHPPGSKVFKLCVPNQIRHRAPLAGNTRLRAHTVVPINNEQLIGRRKLGAVHSLVWSQAGRIDRRGISTHPVCRTTTAVSHGTTQKRRVCKNDVSVVCAGLTSCAPVAAVIVSVSFIRPPPEHCLCAR